MTYCNDILTTNMRQQGITLEDIKKFPSRKFLRVSLQFYVEPLVPPLSEIGRSRSGVTSNSSPSLQKHDIDPRPGDVLESAKISFSQGPLDLSAPALRGSAGAVITPLRSTCPRLLNGTGASELNTS